jgi:hypothetical protein
MESAEVFQPTEVDDLLVALHELGHDLHELGILKQLAEKRSAN